MHLGQQGCGINYDFDDGEHITSQFEYMFSKFLKDNGLKYNLDYFRDVKYSEFIDDYNGNMNCDYVIHICNKIIYIEIAGIIEAYKEWYYSNKSITRSKSKERYRQKLYAKESMLNSNNLIYFILFPCDLTKENFKNILDNPSLELKKEIEDKSLENAKEKLGELDKKWDEKHDKLAYYIEHDELEKVDTAIVQVKSFVENEEIPSAIAELETGKFVLEHIERKYKFNLQNIF